MTWLGDKTKSQRQAGVLVFFAEYGWGEGKGGHAGKGLGLFRSLLLRKSREMVAARTGAPGEGKRDVHMCNNVGSGSMKMNGSYLGEVRGGGRGFAVEIEQPIVGGS